MAAQKAPNIPIIGTDAHTFSMVCLDLPDCETALELGKRIAAENGRKVKVRDRILGEAKRAKGLDTVILAFAEIASQNPEAFLAIASGGNELEEMKDLARKNIPPGRYEFIGFVPEEDMRQFYSELDLFLFPSRYGFGLSAVEAMACGTPAIVGRTLDSTDFFTHELSLVDPNSPAELAGRISLLLTDRQRHAELREWALKRVQSLSWKSMAEKYVEFWKEIRSRHTSGDRL